MLACRRCFTFDVDKNRRCLRCGSNFYVMDIDDGIADVIKDYWKARLFTDNSCAGHVDDKRFCAYLLFPSNFSFAEWISTHKEDIERNYKPVKVHIHDRGFVEIVIKEKYSWHFNKKKRENAIIQFRNALIYTLELYKNREEQTDGA